MHTHLDSRERGVGVHCTNRARCGNVKKIYSKKNALDYLCDFLSRIRRTADVLVHVQPCMCTHNNARAMRECMRRTTPFRSRLDFYALCLRLVECSATTTPFTACRCGMGMAAAAVCNHPNGTHIWRTGEIDYRMRHAHTTLDWCTRLFDGIHRHNHAVGGARITRIANRAI